MLIAILLAACGGSPTPTPEATAPPTTTTAAAGDPDPRLDAGRSAAKALGGRLKGRLLEAMATGPVAAATVCADEAQTLTAQAQGQAQVGRASLRLRNPKNAGPDWVRAWLAEQGERPVDGVKPLEVVTDGHARVILPIAVEAPCLACHGDTATLAPEIASLLASRYPDDRATGYKVGDLRGALWAEVP